MGPRRLRRGQENAGRRIPIKTQAPDSPSPVKFILKPTKAGSQRPPSSDTEEAGGHKACGAFFAEYRFAQEGIGSLSSVLPL